MLRSGMSISSIFNTQHVATRGNRTAKCTQHVAPIMLRYVALNGSIARWPKHANAGPTMLGYVLLKCCDRLAGALFSSQLILKRTIV